MKLQDRASTVKGFTPNKRGHDKSRPLFVSVKNPFKTEEGTDDWGYKRNSLIVYHMADKIRRFMHKREEYAELGYTQTNRYIECRGDYKQLIRSDKAENITNVALYFLHHVEPISGKVGVPGATKSGHMRILDREHVLNRTGLSYEDYNESVKYMIKHGMLHRQRTWSEKEDGSYGGRPSICRLLPAFWELFGIADKFSEWFKYKYDELKRKSNDKLKQVAKSIRTGFSNPKKQSSSKVSYSPDTIQYYQSRLPKTQHGAFQAAVGEKRSQQPSMPLIDLFTSVFNQFKIQV